MKNNKKSSLLAAICGGIALVSVACGVFALQKDTTMVDAATPVITEGQFAQEYAYGQSFELPDSVKIEYDGKEYEANKGYIIYPDGCAHSGAESYVLDKVGQYTVVYQAEIGGKMIAARQNFAVMVGMYSLDAASSLEYDTLRAFSVYKNLTAEQRAEGLRMGDLETDVKGLNIYLESGNTFTYNKPINIYENTSNSVLEFNSIQLEPVAKSWSIRLTDCYDPNTFLEVSFSKVAIDETYARLGANGLTTVGLRESTNAAGDANIDGKVYNKDRNGSPVRGNRSIDYTPSLSQDRYNNITLRLDTTDRKAIKVYLDCISARGEEPATYLVGQLNNKLVFPYAFEGFTNGDVYLSLTARDFNGVQTAEFEIKSIMGVSGEGLIPKDYKDETPPQITINAPEVDIKLVAGVPIKVPAANAIDASGVCGGVDYTVWYAYGTENKRMIQIKDRQFTPVALGKYTIEYYASDVCGNVATRLLDMHAVKEGEDAISFTCNEIGEVAAGQFVSFDDYTIETLTPLRVFALTITLPNGEVREISNPSQAFRLSSTGEYVVTYTYADTFYEGEYSYSFEAKDAGNYSFDGDVILPKYFIKGASYTLEKTKLYRYSGAEPQQVETKAYVRYGTGAYTEIDAATFTVTGDKKATIKYVCVEDEKVFIESDEIEIIDVGYNTAEFDKSKYFKGSFTASTSQDVPDRTTYTYKFSSTAKPELDFINVLSLRSFGIKFAIPAGQKTKAVSLILTDYYNRSNQVTLTITQEGASASFSFNGGESVGLADALIGAPVNVLYTDAGQLQIGNTKVLCPISFTTDLCLLTVKITGLSHGNKFEVLSVCNQSFNHYIVSDTAKPIITAKMPENVAKIGDIIPLERPVYADVFSPTIAAYCTASVYRNGKPIAATNGELLKGVSDFDKNYAFEIDGYGSYLIVYEVVDGAGKKQDVRHTITVTDNEAPTITLNNYKGSAIGVSVGVKTPVIAYTASDNYTSAEKLEIWLFVYNERGVCVSAEKDGFTISQAGKYTVYVYCIDEAGNTSYVTYEVKAK